MLKYCIKCVLPNTKPHLPFDGEGVCDACLNYENRSLVDWVAKKKELKEVLNRYRSEDKSSWDCVVPVSGGKDSTFQVIKVLQLGFNPLCVTATTCDLSEVGRKNIENIKSLGVDLVEFSPNPVVRKKLNRIGLTKVGDIAWPEHVGIFTIPVRVAVQFGVPLIIWGENSQNEYGGPDGARDSKTLDRRWLEEFGGLLGLRVSDLSDMDGIETKHLIP
jgi:N-acetyl sugar amidotransferase